MSAACAGVAGIIVIQVAVSYTHLDVYKRQTSSILQPFTGLSADRHPRPYALSVGMCFTLAGLLMLAFAENYLLILLAVSVVGFGSSVFHPTASSVTQLASGGKKSLAQSIFQVGGNGGSAVGPLLALSLIHISCVWRSLCARR